jgi:lipopolysaccharide transport system permease protein
VLDSDLLSKVYFPRLALPISKALGLMLDLAIALVVVVVVTLAYGVSIASTVYLVPAFLLLGVITAFAIATLLAALNVKYRDVQVLVPMLVQILFFASPVIYSGSTVGQTSGEVWSYLYYLNPMATVLDGTRWALLVGQPAPGAVKVLISIASASVLLVGAILYFRRAEQFFADVI